MPWQSCYAPSMPKRPLLATPDKYGPIVAETNGHKWFFFSDDKFMSCRVCGMIRRADDKNSPCRGKVRLDLR